MQQQLFVWRMRILTTICTAFFVGVVPVVCHASAGISPASFTNDHLLPGSKIAYTASVNSGDLTTDAMTLNTSVEGDIQSWVTLSASTLTLTADAPQANLGFTVTVPTTTNQGTYTGTVHIIEQALPGAQDLHSVVSLSLPLTFTVIDTQQDEYTVSDLNVVTLEEDDPLFLYYTVDNTGNVASGPNRATVDIDNAEETRQLFSETTPITTKIPAFTYATASAVFTRSLPVGEYWLHARILSDTVEQQTRKLHLDIVPKGSLGLHLSVANFAVSKNPDSPTVVNLTGAVQNNSDSQVVAYAVISVHNQDNALMSVDTETTQLAAHEQKTIAALLPAASVGEYRVTVEVHYPGHGQITVPDSLQYSVAQTDTGTVVTINTAHMPLWLKVLGGIACIAAVLFAVIMVLVQKKHKLVTTPPEATQKSDTKKTPQAKK